MIDVEEIDMFLQHILIVFHNCINYKLQSSVNWWKGDRIEVPSERLGEEGAIVNGTESRIEDVKITIWESDGWNTCKFFEGL